MVMFCVTVRALPIVRVIVPVTPNVISSPSCASAIASRRVQALTLHPSLSLSNRVVTVNGVVCCKVCSREVERSVIAGRRSGAGAARTGAPLMGSNPAKIAINVSHDSHFVIVRIVLPPL